MSCTPCSSNSPCCGFYASPAVTLSLTVGGLALGVIALALLFKGDLSGHNITPIATGSVGIVLLVCAAISSLFPEKKETVSQPKSLLTNDYRPNQYGNIKDWSNREYRQPIPQIKNGPIPLDNIVNTCYINSTLQPIFTIPPICDAIVAKKDKNDFTKALYNVFIEKEQKNMRSLLTKFHDELFLAQNSPWQNKIETNKQEDAQELLTFILDQLEWNPLHLSTYIESNSLPEKLTHTTKVEKHSQLSVAIKETFELSLFSFFNEQEMDGGFTFDTINGKKRVDECFIKHQIDLAPEYLIVHLKRFNKEKFGSTMYKLTDHISFPSTGSVCIPIPQQRTEEYEIISYINHIGASPGGGHYTADVQKTIDGQNNWFKCDDETVTKSISPCEIEQITPFIDKGYLSYEDLNLPGISAYIVILKRKTPSSKQTEI